jgi:outer membrane protein TolC
MTTRLMDCRAGMAAVALAALVSLPGQAVAQVAAAGPQVPREGGTPLPAAPSMLATGQSIVLGGVPVGQVSSTVLPVSLGDAIARGLKQNLGIVLGEQAVKSASGTRWQSLSGVLPTAGLRLGQTREEINLEEYGFPVAPGQSPIIGPFSVSAVHITAVAPVFDYSAIQRARAGGQVANAATHSFRDMRDVVAFVTANLYLQAVAGASRI